MSNRKAKDIAALAAVDVLNVVYDEKLTNEQLTEKLVKVLHATILEGTLDVVNMFKASGAIKEGEEGVCDEINKHITTKLEDLRK